MSRPPAAALVLALCAGLARAAVEVEVGNADKITGTLSPATEVETFHFRVPRGALVTVKAKAAKKGPSLHVELTDTHDAGLGMGDLVRLH